MEGLVNLQRLLLDVNQLTGQIPAWLGNLDSLQVLLLFQNQFTGCVPHELRRVATNDLDTIDLVHCDVLLSGLRISPGRLTPRFDPYHTEYSASTDSTRITIVPISEYDAVFRFLDADDMEILDADDAADGHQIQVVGGGTTVKVEVLPQDQVASHTYTVVVTVDDIVSRYDKDGNGVIDREEVIDAVVDYFDGLITREDVLDIIEAYFNG